MALIFPSFVLLMSGYVVGEALISTIICAVVFSINKTKLALLHALSSVGNLISCCMVAMYITNTELNCAMRAPLVGFFHLMQVLMLHLALFERFKAIVVMLKHAKIFLWVLRVCIAAQVVIMALLYGTTTYMTRADGTCRNGYHPHLGWATDLNNMVYLILVNTVFVSKLYETFKKFADKRISLLIGNSLFFPILILISCVITIIVSTTTTDMVVGALISWINCSIMSFSQAMLCLVDNWNSIGNKYNGESGNSKANHGASQSHKDTTVSLRKSTIS